MHIVEVVEDAAAALLNSRPSSVNWIRRVLCCKSRTPTSASSRATPLPTADADISSARPAATKLPRSAVFTKASRPLSLSIWVRRADCGTLFRSDGLKTRVAELIAYLGRNRERLVDYGTRHRSGLPISTSMAESAVESVIGDRFKKNRKMRWTPKGANALLHIRVANLNDELGNALKERHRARTRPANEPAFYSYLAAAADGTAEC